MMSGFVVKGHNVIADDREGSLALRACPACGYEDWDITPPCPRCAWTGEENE
jgi:hypothetical protein